MAERAVFFSQLVESEKPALVNGAAGIVSWLPGERPFSVMGFALRNAKIIEIHILSDPARRHHVDLSVLDD